MAIPSVPPEARPLLEYLPTIANFIQTNRRPSRGELSMLRMFAPDAFRRLKALSYEEIVALASPYESDPKLGAYVRLVKSDQGRAWLSDVLVQIHSM